MKKKILYFACAWVMFLATGVFADTVTLKSKEQIEGNIAEMGNDWIKLDVAGNKTTYFFSEIDKINGEKVNLLSPPEKTPASITQNKTVISRVVPPSVEKGVQDLFKSLSKPNLKKGFQAPPYLKAQRDKLKKGAVFAAGGIILIAFIVIIFLYAFSHSSTGKEGASRETKTGQQIPAAPIQEAPLIKPGAPPAPEKSTLAQSSLMPAPSEPQPAPTTPIPPTTLLSSSITPPQPPSKPTPAPSQPPNSFDITKDPPPAPSQPPSL